MRMLGAPEPAARSEGQVQSTRCPDCGGLNPHDAEWCGQCLARFEPAPSEEPGDEAVAASTKEDFASWAELLAESDRPEADADFDPMGDRLTEDFDPLTDPLPTEGAPGTDPAQASIGAESESTPGAEGSPGDPVKRRAGVFAVAGARISWTCSRCDTDNPLEAAVCRVCGASFAEIVGPPAPPQAARDPNMAAFVSLFYPGAGHAYLGMWGQAVARAALSTWVVAVTIFALVGRSAPGAILLGGVFGLCALALWAVAAHDAFRDASNQRDQVILKPRAFLYVTILLLFVLFASLVLAGFNVARGP